METPADFLAAVRTRFGEIDWDLACCEGNCKGRRGRMGSVDSREVGWERQRGLVSWLNPPFAEIGSWVSKCEATAGPWGDGGRILVLLPASIGSRWFADHVHGKALVLALSPRLTFVGHTAPYPKDLMLLVYGTHPGFDVWRWR